METIFDHNPTEGELRRFNITTPEIAEEIKPFFTIDSDVARDDNYYYLGVLFAMRKDYKKANEYWNKIKDKRILSTLVQDF